MMMMVILLLLMMMVHPSIVDQVVGGGSTVNGMLYVRGDREDFDAWERRGNPGKEKDKAKKMADFGILCLLL